MPTRVDPFTGRPLEIRPAGARPYYVPEPDEPDDEDDYHVEGADRPRGFIHTHDRQRGTRFRMALFVPVILVSLLTVIMVGAFTALLGARGTLNEHGDVLVPALIIGGSVASLGGVFAALYLWPSWVPQGPMRTLSYGMATAAFLLGIFIVAVGLVFGT